MSIFRYVESPKFLCLGLWLCPRCDVDVDADAFSAELRPSPYRVTFNKVQFRYQFVTMLDTICSLPLTSELFAQVIHPSEPIIAVGLSSGHVQSFKLPSAPTSADNSPSPDEIPVQPFGRRHSSAASESGLGEIETAWRTRRHKGSCRNLAYSFDGEILYSAGTDGLVKAARSEDGRVVAKIAIQDIGG